MAIAVAPLTSSVLGSVDEKHVAMASGFNSAVARTGGLIATALLGVVLARQGEALLGGFHVALVVGGGRHGRRQRRRADPARRSEDEARLEGQQEVRDPVPQRGVTRGEAATIALPGSRRTPTNRPDERGRGCANRGRSRRQSASRRSAPRRPWLPRPVAAGRNRAAFPDRHLSRRGRRSARPPPEATSTVAISIKRLCHSGRLQIDDGGRDKAGKRHDPL